MASPGHPQGDGGRPNSNITDPTQNRITHPTNANHHQYAQYDGKYTPKNHDTMEALSHIGPSDLQLGLGGLDAANAPRVDGGWHDSSKRKDGKAGTQDHLNVKHGGKQWHVERDGSHSVYNQETKEMERFPGEVEIAKRETHIERKSEGGGTFWTKKMD
jgi:hypothetical protein